MISQQDTISPFAGSPISTRGGLIPEGMLPSGYIEKVIRDARVVSHGSTIEYFQEMLVEHSTLYGWAASLPERRGLYGRRTAWAVPLPGSDVRVVVRHSHHGGMLSSITRDLFRTPRADDELRISWTLRHVGIPTPRVLGYALYPQAGGLLWRADVVTREILDSTDLSNVLSQPVKDFDQTKAIEATITMLRQLSRTWAYHPDLNLKNVLIAHTETGELQAYVIDVDVLRFAEKNAESLNVARMLRSARKLQAMRASKGLAMLIERLGG